VQAAATEHARVLEAMAARDGLRAETEMRAHIEAAQRMRLRALRARQPKLEEE
jgi:DNA-binding GntR family transcriptional regulator